jgi:hypothetical protein
VGLDGTPLGELTTVGVGADEHDLQQMPNGDFLMIAYVRRAHVDLTSIGGPADATVLDGDVQEIAPDGRLVWSWSTKDHIGVEETAAVGVSAASVPNTDGNTFDLAHVNSIEPDGNSVLISARHLDAVYRVRRSDGAIMWKLGGTHRPESLTIKGDPYGVHGLDGQHDARRWPDGTVSVHDNGTFRVRPPRIARYRIDPRRRTATLVEQVRDRMIQSSPCCGSARRLPHGRWFVSWGGRPVIEELTPAGRPVIRLTIAGGFFSYRAQPVAPGAFSRAQLRAGMDAMHPR